MSHFLRSGGRVTQVYGRVGRAEDGLAAIDEGMAASRAQNERRWEAELHRVRGELLLADSADEDEAKAAYVHALEIARTQQGQALELRAVMSLARLIHRQGRTEAARPMLQETYDRFTEGLDTADLVEARALLNDFGCSTEAGAKANKEPIG